MPGLVLNVTATIMCPHGGRAILTTSNSRLLVGGAPALTMADVHMIAGCAFTIALKPSPCLRIQWIPGSTKLMANGVPVITTENVGLCLSPEQAPQGPCVIANPGQARITA
jgi:hypothetical protein